MVGILLLFLTIVKNKSVAGLSRSTQVFYLLVYVTRYLDLMESSPYNFRFKVAYISTSIAVLWLFHKLAASYEKEHDTCSQGAVLMPCAMAAVIFSVGNTTTQVCWTFSEFLEAFAMVPQYIFCYRDVNSKDWGVSLYIMAFGLYRVFYVMNWIDKRWNSSMYSDPRSWAGGAIEIAFFFDYLYFRFGGRSLLRTMVLGVDSKLNDFSSAAEMVTFGTSKGQHLKGQTSSRLTAGDELNDPIYGSPHNSVL